MTDPLDKIYVLVIDDQQNNIDSKRIDFREEGIEIIHFLDNKTAFEFMENERESVELDEGGERKPNKNGEKNENEKVESNKIVAVILDLIYRDNFEDEKDNSISESSKKAYNKGRDYFNKNHSDLPICVFSSKDDPRKTLKEDNSLVEDYPDIFDKNDEYGNENVIEFIKDAYNKRHVNIIKKFDKRIGILFEKEILKKKFLNNFYNLYLYAHVNSANDERYNIIKIQLSLYRDILIELHNEINDQGPNIIICSCNKRGNYKGKICKFCKGAVILNDSSFNISVYKKIREYLELNPHDVLNYQLKSIHEINTKFFHHDPEVDRKKIEFIPTTRPNKYTSMSLFYSLCDVLLFLYQINCAKGDYFDESPLPPECECKNKRMHDLNKLPSK